MCSKLSHGWRWNKESENCTDPSQCCPWSRRSHASLNGLSVQVLAALSFTMKDTIVDGISGVGVVGVGSGRDSDSIFRWDFLVFTVPINNGVVCHRPWRASAARTVICGIRLRQAEHWKRYHRGISGLARRWVGKSAISRTWQATLERWKALLGSLSTNDHLRSRPEQVWSSKGLLSRLCIACLLAAVTGFVKQQNYALAAKIFSHTHGDLCKSPNKILVNGRRKAYIDVSPVAFVGDSFANLH